jgi:hypothetical protein
MRHQVLDYLENAKCSCDIERNIHCCRCLLDDLWAEYRTLNQAAHVLQNKNRILESKIQAVAEILKCS